MDHGHSPLLLIFLLCDRKWHFWLPAWTHKLGSKSVTWSREVSPDQIYVSIERKKTLNVIKSTFLSLFKYFKFANKQKKLFSSYIHMSINNLYDLSKQIKYHLWEKLEKKKYQKRASFT
jgi:hypothetical protein